MVAKYIIIRAFFEVKQSLPKYKVFYPKGAHWINHKDLWPNLYFAKFSK